MLLESGFLGGQVDDAVGAQDADSRAVRGLCSDETHGVLRRVASTIVCMIIDF
jgi:hypothetical protein